MKNSLLILLALSSTVFCLERGNGDRVDSFPSYYERQLLVLTDACRMAPTQYRNLYVGNYPILLPQNYPPVKPLYWNLALNQSSRAQAIDMANNCGLQHNSCNGTGWATRIQSYYLNKSGTIGENIATGYSTALATLTQWILEVDPSTTPVPADLSGSDGHRQNIMRATYLEMGCGYAWGPEEWNYFWVQDFGGGTPDFSDPLVSGSHFFFSADSITFYVNYYDSLNPPADLTATVAGVNFPMALVMGTQTGGTWALTLKKDTTSRQYFFSCSSAGTSWRYPAYGMLLTAGEGRGTDDYMPPESLAVTAALLAPVDAAGQPKAFLLNNTLHIVNGRQAGIDVALFDVNGRVVFRENYAQASEIPLPRWLLTGAYLLRVKSGEAVLLDRKIVLTR